MNSLINVNVIFCEKYDSETNSYTNLFDNMKLEGLSIDGFDMIILTNRVADIRCKIQAFFCKMKESENEVDHTVFFTEFEIPEKKGTSVHNTESFISHIDIDNMKEKGLYKALVFAKIIDGESDTDDNEILGDDYHMVSNINLIVK